MSNINNVDTVPDYINKFIVSNEEGIKNIYTEEKSERGNGFIYININVKENKLDLIYLTNEQKNKVGTDDETLNKLLVDDKILIMIDDNEYKTRFIIYI
jgi:hypothetical protein